MAIGRSRALGAALLLLAGGARPASGAARSVMFARGRVAAPLVRRPGAPRGLALCAARGKTITENLDEVPRERLVEICNALRDRWGSVERIYDDMTVAGPPGSDNFQQIDMEAFMGAVEAAEVRCSRAEMAQVFKAVDLDNSGTLEMEELRLALRESGAILRTYQQSLTTMVASIGAAVLFGVGVGVVRGPSDAADFATAYIIEDSLSVDNLFVFVLLFEYFRVPLWLQQRCLTLGIAGATILRGLFIGGGLVLIDKFHALVVIFGAFLVFSSYKLLAPGGDGDDDDDLANNAVVKWATNTFNATSDFDGGRLFTRRGMGDVEAEGGGLLARFGRPTPLLIVLVCIELSDILFAVDSIPAVFGVTSDPFIAFSSNIFAIIGLRSLYSVLASAVQDLAYLEQSVAIVLGFVGVKLLAQGAGYELGTALSLGVVLVVLGVGIGMSLWENQAQLEPGSEP